MARRPLRVAFVTASLDVGGSERQMVQLAERLPRDRFTVEFVLLTRRGPLAERAERAGIRIHTLDWAPGRSIVRHQPDLWRFVRTVRRGRFDILDAWLFHAYAVASLSRPLTRVPVLIAGRRSLSHHKHAFGRVDRVLDRLTRHRVDAIVANSEAVRTEVAAYEGLDPRQIRVIHNGIEPREPLDPSGRAAIRAGWDAELGDIVVGCVANYKAGKGLETLIRAMASVVSTRPAAGPAARLVLVGEGPRRDGLQRLAEELGLRHIVRFHGAEPDAQRIIGAFDVAVQASVSEGLPNAVLEAAAAGVPVVATDVGGTAEALDGGTAGILVPIEDEAALADGITRLAGNQALRREIGERAREFVRTEFSLERFVDRTAELYEELAAAKGLRE
jgi:glycosyltransferase involved in cell wall biosynthesis